MTSVAPLTIDDAGTSPPCQQPSCLPGDPVLPMTKKRDLPKRPLDRRPSLGGNLVWSLVAAGVAGLFAMSLIGTVPELELSFSDLERLIVATRSTGEDRWIEIGTAADGTRQPPRYGDLRDVVIGAFQVAGTVRERPTAAEQATAPAESTPRGGQAPADGVARRFRTAKLPSESAQRVISLGA